MGSRLRACLIRRNYSRAISYVIGAILFPAFLNAQSESLNESWRSVLFTTESGLPADQVYDILDRPGRTIWASTKSGLAWYDGYRWHCIDSLRGIPKGQPTAIAPFRNDEIVAIVHSRLYVGSTDGFHLIATGLQGDTAYILSVVQLSEGRLLLLTAYALLAYENGALHRFPLPPSSRILTDGNLNLWKTSKGSIYINTSNGLYRRDGESWQSIIQYRDLYFGVRRSVEDGSGSGIAAVGHPPDQIGLWEWTSDGAIQRSSTERSSLVQTMDIGPDEEALVAYESGEVRIRRGGRWTSLNPLPPEMVNILFLRYRTNGDLWIGTERGLYLHRRSSSRWSRWRHPFPDPRNSVHEIYQSSDGSIWLGTMRGVEVHRPDGSVWSLDTVLGMPLQLVTGIIEDENRNMWICSGASFDGAYRWDGVKWKHFGASEGLPAPRVHKIRKDRRGRLWFLGLGINYSDPKNQPGAFVYDGATFTRWGTEEGLRSGRVYAFAEHPNGAYWFGTYGGLCRWHNGRWTHWTENNELPAIGRIPTLTIDREGVVWFTDQKSGLGYIDKNDRARFLTMQDGLVSHEIWDLRVDDQGVLWISTRNGLSSYRNGIFTTYGTKLGLGTLRLWEILPLLDRVYIGSSGSGVNILNRREASPPPSVEFSKPVIEGSDALLRWRVYPYWGELPIGDIESRFRVDHGSWSSWSTMREMSLTNLEEGMHVVEVQAKGFFGDFESSTRQISFRTEPHIFRRPQFLFPVGLLTLALVVLVGVYFDRRRKQDAALRASEVRYRGVVEDQMELVCRFLPDGTLSFVNEAYCRYHNKRRDDLIGANIKNLLQGEERASFDPYLGSFSRERPVQSVEYSVTLPSGDIRWHQWTDRAILDERGRIIEFQSVGRDTTERKRAEKTLFELSKRILEAQESERRRVARELHDSVNQILASIKFRIESLEEKIPGRLSTVKRDIKHGKQLLDKVMLEVRRICRNLRPSELDDLGLASALRSLVHEFSERTGIALSLNVPETTALPPEVELTLYRIVQESLTNVEKHARANHVAVDVSLENSFVTASIHDNGKGFNPSSAGRRSKVKSGMGLVDMKERLVILGGTIEVHSRPRKGTTIVVHLPVNNTHRPRLEDL